MVTTGFSRIHVAKYSANGSAVSYTGCQELARARNMDLDITTTEDNNYYANNQLAETEPAAFKEGALKLTVDGLTADEEAMILGIEESKQTVGGQEVAVIKYGAKMNPPYLGVGAVKRMQLNGAPSYRPIILTKTRFAIPPEAVETQEENINWQDQELNATIMRDDTADKVWKIIPKTNYDTEDEAVAFIKAILGGNA